MSNTLRQMRIVSNGTAHGTYLLDANGMKVIAPISRIVWSIDASTEIAEATVTFSLTAADLQIQSPEHMSFADFPELDAIKPSVGTYYVKPWDRDTITWRNWLATTWRRKVRYESPNIVIFERGLRFMGLTLWWEVRQFADLTGDSSNEQ